MNKPEQHCPRCGVLLPQDQFAFAVLIQKNTLTTLKPQASTMAIYDTLLCPSCASATFLEE
jgi:ribosomal protein S27AE